ncbi:hypothetical protein [Fusibacter ferrireducens]|uniref:MacB-like periplasmic core domain-containing protein n=1 Tax=Fusibacter ferrireducens TaxID=2785058 RepID=A0ABS0A176_9FIRM|nr:hypothetical protein [Fusibacter ferrireducens]MBF4695971.1 hypothetical protein [Fusibacter ferrireducens]
MGKKLFKHIFISKFNFQISSFIFFLCALMTLVSTNFILHNVPNYEKLPNENYIELLNIAEPAASYINASVTEEAFQKKYANANNRLDVKELIELSKKSYIDKVYVIDEKYMIALKDNKFALPIVSIPKSISQSPNYERSYPGFSGFLISGRLPNDNEFEAVVSYPQMQSEWHFEGNMDAIIGSKIKINQKDYTVVGITNLPIVAISFQHDRTTQYGVIEVSTDSEVALNEIIAYKLANGWSDSNLFFDNVFILYKAGSENQLMPYLVENAPSYQYTSNYVNEVVKMDKFKRIMPQMMVYTIILCMVFSLVIILVARKFFEQIYNDVKETSNPNFQPDKNDLVTYSVLATDFLFALPMMFICSYLILRKNIIFQLPFFLICILMFALSIGILKFINRKGD